MIQSISIRDFQSLADVELELGSLNVIVGASNSGKSALVRALKLLASNAPASAYVRHGAKFATVQVTVDDVRVGIERGPSRSAYYVGDNRYPKAGTGVPEAVASQLNLDTMDDGPSINIAGQFDRPYLLAESGASSARVLGDLTNVTTLFEAVREGNKRRLQLRQRVSASEERIDDLQAQVQRFKGLPQRLQAQEEAELLLEELRKLVGQRDKIARAATAVTVARQAIERHSVPELLDLMPLKELIKERAKLARAFGILQEARESVTSWDVQAGVAELEVREAHAAMHQELVDAGVCPTCGQEIK